MLKNNGGRIAEPGATSWAFEKNGEEWRPKFKQELGNGDKEKTEKLLATLEELEDVQKVYTNLP